MLRPAGNGLFRFPRCPSSFVLRIDPEVGTGGMDSKVKAATWALDRGVSVVICNGMQEKAIKTIIGGRKVGTFFTESTDGFTTPVEELAESAREGSRQLQTLTPEQRASAVHTLADLLVSKEQFILEANAKDLSDAQRNGLAKPLLSRLSLSTGKLKNLSVGLKQIADSSHKHKISKISFSGFKKQSHTVMSDIYVKAIQKYLGPYRVYSKYY
uniref:Uncharacterized protein n=1 Tax=Glossina pallidipes TaxID=7398 RepID=A0A1B0AE21_GLOPL